MHEHEHEHEHEYAHEHEHEHEQDYDYEQTGISSDTFDRNEKYVRQQRAEAPTAQPTATASRAVKPVAKESQVAEESFGGSYSDGYSDDNVNNSVGVVDDDDDDATPAGASVQTRDSLSPAEQVGSGVCWSTGAVATAAMVVVAVVADLNCNTPYAVHAHCV